MKENEKMELSDIAKIKRYLITLGFVCNSNPSAQNLIYNKKEDTVIIKNRKK